MLGCESCSSATTVVMCHVDQNRRCKSNENEKQHAWIQISSYSLANVYMTMQNHHFNDFNGKINYFNGSFSSSQTFDITRLGNPCQAIWIRCPLSNVVGLDLEQTNGPNVHWSRCVCPSCLGTGTSDVRDPNCPNWELWKSQIINPF